MMRIPTFLLPVALMPLLAAGPGGEVARGPEPVSFVTADGITIHGWAHGPHGHGGKHRDEDGRLVGEAARRPAVVLLHMFRSDKQAWWERGGMFPLLSEHGILGLSIDMRGHGESRSGPGGEDLRKRVVDRDPALFNAMWKDAAAAVKWLREVRGVQGEIGLVGASVGCSVAIDTARRDESLRDVVVMTPGLDYLGVDTRTHLRAWGQRELLILTSEEEASASREIARVLDSQRAAREAEADEPEPSRVTLTEFNAERVHGTRMFGAVEGVAETIAAWLEERLDPAPAQEESAEDED